MAAQPFDKETIDKVTEAFKKLNTESDKTLSQLEASAQAEQKMVDMAKQLGQVYKTQQDKIDDQLKGKNLQEKIQLRIKNSEEELNKISASRINSQTKINSLENELLESTNKLKQVQSKDPLSSSVKDLKDIIQKKEEEINLEKQLLISSKDNLSTLQKEVDTQKILNNTLTKMVELVALIGGTEFIKDLNVPKSFNDLLSRIYSLFKEIDKSATELRKTFGLFRSDAEIIETNIREIVIELGEFGVKADDVKKAMSAIGKNFNYIDVLDKSIVKDISIMSKQMGISEEKSSKFLKAIGGIKGQSGLANKSMLSMAGATAAAYGVGLDELMSDVADASEEARMYAGKNADEMVRAAAQARQMGTTLDSMARTAKGLLDFESSIQSELKASALIGKNINFNEARRLAFQGKVVEANKLILDQAKKIKFNQLNPIAQEAFAKAAGKTVKELQDMLESESRMKSALTSNNKEVREAAKAQLEKQNLLKNNSKLAQQEYEKNLLNKANQERIVILQNRLNAALQKIMLPVLEALTSAMERLVNLTEGMDLQSLIKDLSNVKTLATALKDNFIKKIKVVKDFLTFPFKSIKALLETVNKLIDLFSSKSIAIISDLLNKIKSINTFILDIPNKISKAFGTLKTVGSLIKGFLQAGLAEAMQPFEFITKKLKGMGSILDVFKPIKDLIDPISKGLKSLFSTASQFPKLMKIMKIAGFGLKWASGLGEVISVLEFLYKTYKNVMEVINDPNLSFTEKLIGAFKGIAKAAYSAFLETFVDIGAWIGENVFGSFYDVMIDAGESVYNFFGKVIDGTKKVVTALWTGVKDIFGFLIPDVIIEGFNKAYDGIKEWLGFSPSQLGLSIVNGIKSVMDMLFDVLTYPFRKSFELIKSAVSEVGTFIKDTFSGAFTFIIGALEKVWEKMKGIGSFISDTIGKTFSFVGRIVGTSEETPSKTATESKTSVKTDDLLINTIVNSNRVLAEKLDKLTSMMASGQIAVYIDGQRANQLLATSNSKFGSFGQATTN